MAAAAASLDLSALETVVAAYLARDARTTDQALLTVELQRKRALINRLELDFARDAARFDAGYDEAVLFNPGAISWMREHCRMTSTAAANAVCVGEHIERLQRSAASLSEGRIGFAHLTLMARTAEAIGRSPTASALFDEDRLLGKAETLPVVRFHTVCDNLRHAADKKAFLEQQQETREWRTLELTACEEGGLAVHGFLDHEGGAVLRSALEPLAHRSGVGDLRPRAQRYADALVELCGHALDSGAVPQRASQRSHLQVTTSLETLLDLAGAPAAELELAGLVAGATVRRLACDATITRVLLDPSSQVIDVGRSERVVRGATRRALNVRDGGCRWPGCTRSASWTAAHHIVHWTHGGRTDLDNLVLLCRRHHWSVHEGGWQLVRTGDGAVFTVRPPALEPLCTARAPSQPAVA